MVPDEVREAIIKLIEHARLYPPDMPSDNESAVYDVELDVCEQRILSWLNSQPPQVVWEPLEDRQIEAGWDDYAGSISLEISENGRCLRVIPSESWMDYYDMTLACNIRLCRRAKKPEADNASR